MKIPFSSLPDEVDSNFDDRYGGAVILDDSNQFPEGMSGAGLPHITLAVVIVGLIGLKYLSDKNFITTNTQQFQYSAMDTLGKTFQVFVGLVLLKLATLKLVSVAPDFPGARSAAELFAFI